MEIAWGIFTLIIFIIALVYAIQYTKNKEKNHNAFAVIVLALFLFSLMSSKKEKNSVFNLQQNNSQTEKNTLLKSQTIDKSLSNTYYLDVVYSRSQVGATPIRAQVQRSGWIYGTDWKTTSIDFYKNNSN